MEKTMQMAMVYETLLCSPGMAESVKLDMRVSRKALLLLAASVESQLKGPAGSPAAVTDYFGVETVEELEKMISDMLLKSELSGLHSKLKTLQNG
ncbi:hypothetical protein [Dyadobacter psychrotolerans]|uniref:Uncharacterized protein n=1 Tax=Dyadobacter psychrotolerans TaxID=2541721 RepID=A0A4R5E0J7_9BACT|nr:hypothetical protein [Dyadobacter psychrotolerans]TDE18041.1 hypothetical protein E0F88_00350 [Dyadobacter psychrotolerans]